MAYVRHTMETITDTRTPSTNCPKPPVFLGSTPLLSIHMSLLRKPIKKIDL